MCPLTQPVSDRNGCMIIWAKYKKGEAIRCQKRHSQSLTKTFAGVTSFLDSTMYIEKVPPQKGEGIQRDDQEKMVTKGSHSHRSTSENEGRGCLQQRHDHRGLNSTMGVVDTQR